MNRTRRGPVTALTAAFLFGISTPLCKVLLRGTAPQLVAGLLYLGSGLGLAVVRLAQRRASREAPLGWGDAPWLAGAIGFGGILGPLLLMLGLARVPSASASLLLNLEAVFTALLAWFAFRENFDRRIAFGMIAIVAGGVALSWQGRMGWGGPGGSLLVAGACLSWAVDNNLTQKVSAGDPVQIAMLKGLAAGAVNTTIALSAGAGWPTPQRTGAVLAVGFLSYGVSLVLFVRALRHLGTARTSAYFSTAPFVGAAASVLFLREQPAAGLGVAAGLMALGVWSHLSERHEHEHRHEAIVHEHLHMHDEHHLHAHDPLDQAGEPHTHPHRHEELVHTHRHSPDIHHRHRHGP